MLSIARHQKAAVGLMSEMDSIMATSARRPVTLGVNFDSKQLGAFTLIFPWTANKIHGIGGAGSTWNFSNGIFSKFFCWKYNAGTVLLISIISWPAWCSLHLLPGGIPCCFFAMDVRLPKGSGHWAGCNHANG